MGIIEEIDWKQKKKKIEIDNNIFQDFIVECSKEDITSWCNKRRFDLELCKKLKIGKCTLDVLGRLKQKYTVEDLTINGFVSNQKWNYQERIIIPYNLDYFAARHQNPTTKYEQKIKNLFPKGKPKQVFCIKGEQNNDLIILEGETDSIRIKMEFPTATTISIGGCKSKNLLNKIIEETKDIKPKRIIFGFDNDDPGKSATTEWLMLLSKSKDNEIFKDKLFKLNFNQNNKDIDEYFFNGSKKEDLVFEKIELIDYDKKQFKQKDDSIYSRKSYLHIESYISNVEVFYKTQSFFYDKSKMFWLWNNNIKCYEITDETEMMNLIDSSLNFCGQTVTAGIRGNYMEAFKRVGRKHIPKQSPEKWIQFKDKAYSLKSGKIYEVTPDYFFTNPIPWELGDNSDTPVMDKLFEEWVGEKYVKTLYEIIAYCCYRNYPIHLLFCLIGCGRNGKSCFQKLLCKFIGQTNVCSTELDDLLDSRFEKAKLYKKLVCSLGETNFNIISKTSLIKKLTGQDLIGYEFKGKDPFDDYNYAKILINSNSLPSSDDTSEGFYRRWMIINFENTFPEGKDIILSVPNTEFINLSRKICTILPKLIENGEFSNQGDIATRKHKYIINSNPLEIFLNHICNNVVNSYVSYSELYSLYCKFLSNFKKRTVSHKEFTNSLERAGIEIQKTSKKINDEWTTGRFVIGYELKPNFMTLMPLIPKVDIGSYRKESVEKSCISGISGTKPDVIYHKCSTCGNEISHYWDSKGLPQCDVCYQTLLTNQLIEEVVK